MSSDHRRASGHLGRLLTSRTLDELLDQLAPKSSNPALEFPGGARATDEVLDKRWQVLSANQSMQDALLDRQTREHLEHYQANVENLIGTVKVPIGIAGPLRINGLFAHGDYYVPLATTEAALVASCHRGALVISAAGGCTAMLLNEGVSRAPAYAFRNLPECGQFLLWITSRLEDLRSAAEKTTRHGKLADVRFTVEGNHVYLNFEFTTGDASGQNMVTLATDAVCDYIRDHCPIKPQYAFIEGNLSGDKKASAQSFLLVRGKKVAAEVLLSPEIVTKRLNTTPEMMVNYWRMSAVGGVLSGTMGVQGHYANGLAALFLACGQDVACVAESAVGVTRFEVGEGGGLYASVTLPNIMVGTVGGGTGLPSQRACLELMGLAGEGHAAALAEVCAAVCLAGELSIIGALCSGNFSRAHKVLARSRARRKA